MFCVLFFAVLWAGCVAAPLQQYSYSQSVGKGNGNSFSSDGEGRITGVRVSEYPSNYIYGIQLRYGSEWAPMLGGTYNTPLEMELFKDEAIIQVSGKYDPNSYIYQVEFATNRGRFLRVGQPTGTSFNFYPADSAAELRMLSGRQNGPITSLGAHWGVYFPDSTALTTPSPKN